MVIRPTPTLAGWEPVDLFTAAGEFVRRIALPRFNVPPATVLWGSRSFALVSWGGSGPTAYRETTCFIVLCVAQLPAVPQPAEPPILVFPPETS